MVGNIRFWSKFTAKSSSEKI